MRHRHTCRHQRRYMYDVDFVSLNLWKVGRCGMKYEQMSCWRTVDVPRTLNILLLFVLILGVVVGVGGVSKQE